MDVFKINHILLKVIGVHDLLQTFPLKLIIYIQYTILTAFLLFVIVPSLAYVYANLDNIVRATDAAYIFCGFTTNLFTLWSLIAVKETIIETVNEIETLLKHSMLLF